MIKRAVSVGVGMVLLASPLLVSAQTVSASSNTALITVLEQLVAVLTQELQQLIAAQKNQTPTQQNTGTDFSASPEGSTLAASFMFSPYAGAAELTFGDGQNQTFSAGSCPPNPQGMVNQSCVFEHTYSVPGTYSTTLQDSSGNTLATQTVTVTGSSSTQSSATSPSISQVSPQPVSAGAPLTVYLSNGGTNGSITLSTLDGSRFWSTGYEASVSAPSGFAVYDGSQLTFTIPSTIGGEGQNALPAIPITPGTYDLYVTSMVTNANNVVTSNLGKSNVVPIQISPSSALLSASCSGSPYNSGTPGISWGSQVSGGSGTYTYQWNLSNDVMSVNNSLGGLENESAMATYGSIGTKSASVVVSSNGQSTTASCSATIAGQSQAQAPTVSYINPTTAPVGATIDVYGTNFDSATFVGLDGGSGTAIQPSSITLISPSELSFVLPSSLSTGNHTVAVAAKAGPWGLSSPVTLNVNAIATPVLSATCQGSPYNYGTPGVSWASTPSGGTGSYTYQWTLANDNIGTGPSGTSADLQGQNLLATYGSTGTKSTSVVVSSGGQSTTASCSAMIGAPA